MKYLVLIGDGMGDEPIESLGRRTPLQAARLSHINELSKQGLLGLVRTTPDGMVPSSDVTQLNIMGYDPKRWPVARAPLEAASLGISLNPVDVAFRCNLVTFRQEGKTQEYVFDKIGPRTLLEDYSAGHIPTEQARELIQDLNDQIGTETIQFYTGLSYRHLMIWIGGKSKAKCTPPQDVAGRRVMDNLPRGEGEQLLKEITNTATEILCAHPLNAERLEEGQRPANGIWLWGQGKPTSLPEFRQRYGLNGAMVAAVELVKGLGNAIGLEVVEVPGATGYLDTDYEAKARAALKALETKDLVVLHVESPDEAGHEGNLEAKIKALEDLDSRLVGTLKGEWDRFDDLRLLLLCDHFTPVMLRQHTADPVPYLIYEKSRANRIKPSGKDFCEASARESGRLLQDGSQLIKQFIKK